MAQMDSGVKGRAARPAKAALLHPEPTLNENESLSAILLPVPKHNKPFLVEDQWLWLGWGLLRWALRKAKAA